MKTYTPVSRKTVGEDRVAICPNFGCEYTARVKPLKMRFFGFGKYPKCKKHRIPLVYVDERIVDFVDAALACLFDKSGLPPKELIEGVKLKFPGDFPSFINGWVYCITKGRGASLVSRYMDTISNAYLKQLTKKQIKSLKKGNNSKNNLVNNAIKSGIDEIAVQYLRVLKHLRVHSKILNDHQKLKLLSKDLQNFLTDWQKEVLKHNENINSRDCKQKMPIEELKNNYDEILNVGTCRLLLGMKSEDKNFKRARINAFDRFSAYLEFYNQGLTEKFTKSDIKILLSKESSEEIISYSREKKELLSENSNQFMESVQTSKNLIGEISEIKIPNFQERVINKVKELLLLIELSQNNKTIIISEAEELLNDFIISVKKRNLTIYKNSQPLTYAAAIIYAICISNDNLPIQTGRSLAKLIKASPKAVNEYYNKYFKDLSPKKQYDPQAAQLRSSRNSISFYLYELLITNTDLFNLILHLRNISTHEIVSHLGEIINSTNTKIKIELTSKETDFLNKLTEKDLEKLQFMMNTYPDTFETYFSDLVEIIKLLIISNKTHQIIGAVFSIVPFVKYLQKSSHNLLMTQRGLYDVISELFTYLKNSEYSKLFPAQTKSMEGEFYPIDKTGKKRQLIAGARIKIFVMKHIYNGNHYDLRNGVILCPECLNEGFKVNITLPRIRSKEFHHKDSRFEGYTAKDLYEMFSKNRGDPYFLLNLIHQIEKESVAIKCGCHHSVIHDDYSQFNKLINWTDIPKKFGYNDIFELPSEIIHIIIYTCVEAYYYGRISDKDRKEIKNRLIFRLKKRYIIESLYEGFCPVCKEFNVNEHSRAIDYNHLYSIKDLTPEEREKRKSNKFTTLFRKMSCSEIVKEMQKKYHKGGYICHNCHAVLHTNLELAAKIYSDPELFKKVREDKEVAIRKYKQNLINNTNLIKNPLKSEITKFKAFMDYLIAIFKIAKDKDIVSTVDLAVEMGNTSSPVRSFFRRRKNDLEKYGTITFGDSNNPTRFHMNSKGKVIVELLFYLKSYYENYKTINNIPL